MARAVISLKGSDIFCHCADVAEARLALVESRDRLADWSARYERATGGGDAFALLTIGEEMFAWLDQSGWARRWVREAEERVLEIEATGDSADDIALLDAPWELLAWDKGPLASDDIQLFIVARMTAARRQPLVPDYDAMRLLFMASSPQQQTLLEYENEEAAILSATDKAGRVHLYIEETGELEELASRDAPFEALHLSCHGEIDPKRGPFLALEDQIGQVKPAFPGDMVQALGEHKPRLVMLSACRTAERGAETATLPFARQLAKLLPNVLGWDGSVYDHDATTFAQIFYEALGNRATVPFAAAKARLHLFKQSAAIHSAVVTGIWPASISGRVVVVPCVGATGLSCQS